MFAETLRVAVNPRYSRRAFAPTNLKRRKRNTRRRRRSKRPEKIKKKRHRLAAESEARRALKMLGLKPTSIQCILRKLDSVYNKDYRKKHMTPKDQRIPSVRAVRNVKKKYGDKLIFAPLDKNTGCTFICCPHILQQDMEKTFLQDTEHYERVDITLNDFRKKVNDLHNTLPIVSKQKWGITGHSAEIPYAYTLKKRQGCVAHETPSLLPETPVPENAKFRLQGDFVHYEHDRDQTLQPREMHGSQITPRTLPNRRHLKVWHKH